MKQQEFDCKMQELHADLAIKMKAVIEIQDKIAELRKKADTVEIEHALIPKQFETIEQWLNGHPHPNSVNGMRFKSYAQAREVQLCCNTYQFDYHIVKT